MNVTLRSLRLAEAERVQVAEDLQAYMTPHHLAAVFRAVMKVYEIRSKWQRRKGARRDG